MKGSRIVSTRPPTRVLASITVTRAPSCRSWTAAESPAKPAPTTMTEGLYMGISLLPCGFARPQPGSLGMERLVWKDKTRREKVLLDDRNVFCALHNLDRLEDRI